MSPAKSLSVICARYSIALTMRDLQGRLHWMLQLGDAEVAAAPTTGIGVNCKAESLLNKRHFEHKQSIKHHCWSFLKNI